MNIEWKEIPAKYGPNIHYAYLGKIRVGNAHYASHRSKGDPEAYNWATELPGLKQEHCKGQEPTLGEAKAKLERVVIGWFKLTGTPQS